MVMTLFWSGGRSGPTWSCWMYLDGKWGFVATSMLPQILSPSKNRGVPHISLVFREMWETTALHVPLSKVGKKVKVHGLPHLAKNERDMGHPTILGRERICGSIAVGSQAYFSSSVPAGTRWG